MIKALGLAVIFALVSAYHGYHSIQEAKKAISIYRDGPSDDVKRDR